LKSLEAVLFLPDYLMEETLSEAGEHASESMQEFSPAVLYMEQILRIFPKEYTNRLKMIPAWEETLMKYDEAKSGQADKSGGASAAASAVGAGATGGGGIKSPVA
jgi:hypothetical protein